MKALLKRSLPLFIFFILFSGSSLLSAQKSKAVPMPPPAENAVVAAQPDMGQSQLGQRIDPMEFLATGQRWEVRVTQRLGISHGSATARQDSMAAIMDVKRQLAPATDGPEVAGQAKSVQLVIQDDFIGNPVNGLTPPDNGIAVSDIGKLVSVTNTSLRFMDSDGSVNLQADFSDYLSFLNLNGTYFDPKVLYDPTTNKYIMVVLNGSSPPNKVVVGFSTTNDPMDPWFFYAFEGAPDGANAWFDYPNIGISTTDFYVGGNLFGNNGFEQSTMYQMKKAQGHAGEEVDFLFYSNITDAAGSIDFNLVPIGYGYDGTTGPGIFMASTGTFFDDEIQVYYTTDSVGGTPQLEVYSVDIDAYFSPPNSLMNGSSDELRTNDSRLLSGYFADSTLHLVNTIANDFSTFARIQYLQVNTMTQTAQTSDYGLDGFDYAYPVIAPIGEEETSGESVIGFCRSGQTIFPEYRVVNVDSDFNWTSSLLVRQGDSFIDFLGGNVERWGDYTGVTRQFSADGPTVYVAGNFGNSNNQPGTWIAKIGTAEPQAPLADFAADAVQVEQNAPVSFEDQSSFLPTSWNWSFPGSNTPTSTLQFPTVFYPEIGVYDVSLMVTNEFGESDTMKTAYISVVEEIILTPIADFEASDTVIFAGESVTFTDLTANDPFSWSWTFQGGSPFVSSAQNPTVTYNTPGLRRVQLVAQNTFGSDTEVRDAYITVQALPAAPVADFSADQTMIEVNQSVNFTDESENLPTSWNWTFEGGEPATSADENPTVSYADIGVYPVSLTVANDLGDNTITREEYITVGVSSTVESELFSNFSLYPNPVNAGNELRAFFTLQERTLLDFYIIDANGKVVRNLVSHNVKAGNNEISFSTRYLPTGSYYLVLQEQQGSGNVHSTPFIVR